MVNDCWLERWPDSHYLSLNARTSDHLPLVLRGDNTSHAVGMFGFDNYLAKSSDFLPSVQRVWQHHIVGTGMFAVTSKLKALKPVFRAQRQKRGNLSNNVKLAATFLDSAQVLLARDRQCPLLLHLEFCCKLVLRLATRLQQNMLHQCAKMAWMKGGDQCSRIFFQKVAKRRASNRVFQITNSEGQPVTPNKIKTAVFDIDEVKAPGPDGYSSGFFKAAWPIVGEELTRAVLEFFQTRRLLKQINATLISLIPKVANPTTVTEFRPISCCNVLYKTITKILVQRMRTVLDLLISPSQNAFVPGRSIGDNILLAQELFQGYNQQHLPARCALKVDLRKAYDTVEWDFLGAVLTLFGFPPLFFNWIEECVTTASFSLIDQDGRFMYHWRCEELRLFQLGFADDLLLFSKADLSSVHIFKRGLLAFADLLGLQVYWAMAFILPKSIIKEIEKRLRSFLWKGSSGAGYAKVSWQQVCWPVEEGGLGVRDLLALNRGLMSRHLWRVIMADRSSIWVDWVIHYRLRNTSIWTVSDCTGSWSWRKLVRLRVHLRPCITYRVGSGNSFSLWHDPWHGLGALITSFPLGPRHTGTLPTAPLSLVIRDDMWNWPHITDMESIDITHDLPTIHGGQDRIIWTGPRNSFSSAAAYDVFCPPGPKIDCWDSAIRWASTTWRGKHIANASYRALLASLVYHIWEERNRRIFQQTDRTPAIIARIIVDEIRDLIVSKNMPHSGLDLLLVQISWNYGVTRKLKALKSVLRVQRKAKGDLAQNVCLAKGFLEKAQGLFDVFKDDFLLQLVQWCRTVYCRAVVMEDNMLRQRAKLRWLKDGDRCSRVFFRKINATRAKMRVFQITNAAGDVLTEADQEAFFDISEDSAPGPDGFTSSFFKAAWPEIGEDICAAVKEFFVSGRLLKQINATVLVLIPKVQSPTRVSEFRPIACCNVLYKAISKILFISWIEQCVTTAAFSIALNGDIPSVRRLKEVFEEFAALSGLQINPPILNKITSRLAGWTHLNLSLAGRAQLLKSVLGSLHMYWASVFLLPKSIIRVIEQLMRSFLWKGNSGSGLAKVSWAQVCKPKEEGGLGIQMLRHMNLALLMKHVWRILQEDQTSIWVSWVLRYRLRNQPIWTVNISSASWSWRKLVKASILLKEGLDYRVGDGHKFRLWTDLWHPRGPLIHHFPRGPTITGLPVDSRLLSVIHQGHWCWPSASDFDIQRIMDELPPIFPQQPDNILWKPGKFNTQSVLKFLQPASPRVVWYQLMGGKFGLPRHEFILWLAILERLSTLDRIWASPTGQQCVLCGGQQRETHDHLFFHCSFTRCCLDILKCSVRFAGLIGAGKLTSYGQLDGGGGDIS
ncbi:UNVERIFIED_CONTAM: hypothetical protein Sradi_6975500 [Sesamum radiatum]|uniref:Reverse transcriptase domain-containing protein n=1 Tax=Sesamum radiatum TaxID=300843 RepID=A0AAW2JGU5_SESRA